jgi:hypothetical protein
MDEQQVEQPKVVKRKFSWFRISKIILTILIASTVVLGVWLFVSSNSVKAAWASLIHNKRENYVSCEKLPFYPQVDKAFSDHEDIVNKVKAIPGITEFSPEHDTCYIFTGGTQFLKGQAVLEYTSRAARDEAEKIIGKDFFGMPYHGVPVK